MNKWQKPIVTLSARLREPSTWAAIAVVLALGGVDLPDDFAEVSVDLVTKIAALAAALAAIMTPEKSGEASPERDLIARSAPIAPAKPFFDPAAAGACVTQEVDGDVVHGPIMAALVAFEVRRRNIDAADDSGDGIGKRFAEKMTPEVEK